MNYGMVGIVLLGVCTTACSNRTVYETIQHNNRLDCQREPLSQQEECERRTEKSYEEYQRERQELLKKNG